MMVPPCASTLILIAIWDDRWLPLLNWISPYTRAATVRPHPVAMANGGIHIRLYIIHWAMGPHLWEQEGWPSLSCSSFFPGCLALVRATSNLSSDIFASGGGARVGASGMVAVYSCVFLLVELATSILSSYSLVRRSPGQRFYSLVHQSLEFS